MEFPWFSSSPHGATNKRESAGGAEPINKAYRQLYDRGTRCPNNQPPWWWCQPLLFQGAYQSLEMQTTGITTNDRANRAPLPLLPRRMEGGTDRFYGALEIRLTADGTRFWNDRREGVRLPLFDEEHSLLEGLFPKVDKGVL